MCWRVNLPGIGSCFGRVQILDGEDPVVVGGVVKSENKTSRFSINFLTTILITNCITRCTFPLKSARLQTFCYNCPCEKLFEVKTFPFLQLNWPSFVELYSTLLQPPTIRLLYVDGRLESNLELFVDFVLTISYISHAKILACFWTALRVSSPSSVSSNIRRFSEEHWTATSTVSAQILTCFVRAAERTSLMCSHFPLVVNSVDLAPILTCFVPNC